MRALSSDNPQMHAFFKEKNHIEQILFPFFDYLRHTFFFTNTIVSQDTVDVLRNNVSVRDAIILYVTERNTQIISSQYIEQYDTIGFHLFLL